MTVDRRSLLAASFGLGAAAAAAAATSANAADAAPAKAKPLRAAFRQIGNKIMGEVTPNAAEDQTPALQSLIDDAARQGRALVLPEGVFRISDLRLRSGTALIGTARRTVLMFSGGPACITADKADDIVLEDLVIDGAYKALDATRGEGLLSITRAQRVAIDNVEVRNSTACGIALTQCSGRVTHTSVCDVLDAGIKSLDAQGLDISGNAISRCAGNGILVWRSEPGEDGTLVAANRISQVRNAPGGSGEWGNGINVFRAGSVLVQANHICDCTYSAVRGNAASNLQIIANSCERLGEVALYAEFGFEGCVIANNAVDTAATGISVTNFNEGGRLAVIQGNLIRNLVRREKEPEGEKRGEGISVEADAAVTGNTIEGAPATGIQIGWGAYMRDVAATGNVIRRSRVGISITGDPEAGTCLIANNLISQTPGGAIRKMTLGIVAGPDLAHDPSTAGRIALNGNVAV